MDDTQKEALLSTLRTVMAGAGPLLTANGAISNELWQQITGVILFVVPLVWGYVQKYRAAHATSVKVMTALNVGATTATTPAQAQSVINQTTGATTK